MTSGRGTGDDPARKGQVRLAAQVIVVAALVWLLGQWAGGALNLPVRFAFLLDMACLAALAWAFIVLVRARLARNQEN